jgi:protein TonB
LYQYSLVNKNKLYSHYSIQDKDKYSHNIMTEGFAKTVPEETVLNGIIDLEEVPPIPIQMEDTRSKKTGSEDESLYVSAEIKPKFEVNKMGFTAFLQQRITTIIKDKYKKHLVVKDSDGEIAIVIEKDGSISDFQTYGLNDLTLRKELLEIIRTSPKWKPAIQNGLPVRFYKMMKFYFVIPFKK